MKTLDFSFLFYFYGINKMFDGKFIATLAALVVAVLAICNFNTKKVTTTENFFVNSPMSYKVQREVKTGKGDFYSIPGYQATLSPRFSNTQYGANIKYNMPDYKNQAVPCEPLDFGNMANENYQENFTENYGCGSCGGGCGAVGCRKGGGGASDFHGSAPLMQQDFAAGNYHEALDSVEDKNKLSQATDMLPVGDMTTVNALGDPIQAVVYDRFVYANSNSRLRSQGDPIRGDLPIVPCAAEWFRPSVYPNLDLHQGAMNVMGGVDNSTTQAMADLINSTSGESIIAGVNMASMKNTMTNQSMSTVQVSAMP